MPREPTNESVKIVAVYERILGIVWNRLSPTFGQRTIAAIARNVITLQAPRHPLLRHVQVDEAGFHWATLHQALPMAKEEDIGPALDVLLEELFEALSDLIGRLIVSKVAMEARREAAPEVKQ